MARGACRVYATAREPRLIDIDGAVPLKLDVTDAASVEAAVRAAPDVDLLINNAGIATQTISTITDKVMDAMAEWQNRPLDRVYPVVFLDAINVKIRALSPVV
jgi:NAD(P)-dependent dehydrogenase (short-subunit alcohol dehydrogenase family)